MPIEKIVSEDGFSWAIWRLDETEDQLQKQVLATENIPATISHQQKRKEWLGGRILVRTLMDTMGYAYLGLFKDQYGKPYPQGYALQLSLSHSFPYVAAMLSEHGSVGIDLEQPKEKLLRIAPRVLAPGELSNAGTDVRKHCIYWCAKEAMIKVHGKKDLTFAENLLLEPFDMQNEGNIVGRLIVNNSEAMIPLFYRVTSKFVMVFNTPHVTPTPVSIKTKRPL